MTQQQMVLAYIEQNGSITNRQAMIDLGVGRLPSRVNELRASWHKIIRAYGIRCGNSQK